MHEMLILFRTLSPQLEKNLLLRTMIPFPPFPPVSTVFHCFLSALVSALLSASVKRVSVSRMRNFSVLICRGGRGEVDLDFW